MERWPNGDSMGFLELSAGEICYVHPAQTRPIIGLESYRPFMQQLVGQVHFDRSEFIDPQVVLLGSAAMLGYNFRSSVLDPAGRVTSRTPWNYTGVFVLREAGWKIIHTHWSFIHGKIE